MNKELAKLQKEGFQSDISQSLKQIQLKAVIRDHPGRFFVEMKKSYSGYHSCDKCTQHGSYHKHEVTFPSVSSPLLANTTFRRNRQLMPPFEHLDADMVADFPIDCVHCLYLVVVRRLVFLWTDPSVAKELRFNSQL